MKRKPHLTPTLLCNASLLVLLSSAAWAIEPIPKETGVSGFINLGVSAISIETNMLSEFPISELGDDNIDSLTDEPDSESFGTPAIAFELSYTWAESETQIFIGNRLEDFLRSPVLASTWAKKVSPCSCTNLYSVVSSGRRRS